MNISGNPAVVIKNAPSFLSKKSTQVFATSGVLPGMIAQPKTIATALNPTPGQAPITVEQNVTTGQSVSVETYLESVVESNLKHLVVQLGPVLLSLVKTCLKQAVEQIQNEGGDINQLIQLVGLMNITAPPPVVATSTNSRTSTKERIYPVIKNGGRHVFDYRAIRARLNIPRTTCSFGATYANQTLRQCCDPVASLTDERVEFCSEHMKTQTSEDFYKAIGLYDDLYGNVFAYCVRQEKKKGSGGNTPQMMSVFQANGIAAAQHPRVIAPPPASIPQPSVSQLPVGNKIAFPTRTLSGGPFQSTAAAPSVTLTPTPNVSVGITPKVGVGITPKVGFGIIPKVGLGPSPSIFPNKMPVKTINGIIPPPSVPLINGKGNIPKSEPISAEIITPKANVIHSFPKELVTSTPLTQHMFATVGAVTFESVTQEQVEDLENAPEPIAGEGSLIQFEDGSQDINDDEVEDEEKVEEEVKEEVVQYQQDEQVSQEGYTEGPF